MRRLNAIAWIGFATIIGTTLAGACSAGKSATFAAGGSGGGESTQSGDSMSAAALDTSSGALMNTGSSGAGFGGGMGCAADTTKAQQVPLDIFIMLDQSSSMTDIVANNQTKWQAVTTAIAGFVEQPAAAGIEVGIQYFGLGPGGISCPTGCTIDSDCGNFPPCIFGICAGCADSCEAQDYSIPDVEIAPLPGVATSIIQSMAKHAPTTSTPTSAALQGAINYSQTWAITHPMHTVITILATDGDPEECDQDLGDINAIAAGGVTGTPKILTFVIGVGDSLDALNGIAQAGGTTQAFIVDTTQDVNQQFLAAMNQIRGAALACEYLIPLPDGGMPDFSKVNVQYTPGTGSMTPELIPNVTTIAECPSSGLAWYYDNNQTPTEIIMCTAACNTLSQDNKGQIDIVTGCKVTLH